MSDTYKAAAVIGLGYVGLPLALQAVRAGYDVVGIEVDPNRVGRLVARDSYVEDVSGPELEEAFATGRFRVSPDMSAVQGFDIAVITVPTPLTDGEPDLSYVIASAEALAPFIRTGATVILESTTYPGTTEEVVAPLLEAGSGLVAGEEFALGFSPERIDPGNGTWSFAKTPKIVSGVNEWSLSQVQGFFDALVERTVPVSGTREAELAKLMENTFRHVNIALVNEAAMFAADAGIDIWETLRAAATKPFGFMAFQPGPGVGGHCLPIDPTYLDWLSRRETGRPFRFVELANDINRGMPEYVVGRAAAALERRGLTMADSEVLVLGLTYKANSADSRESPALDAVAALLAAGARVRAVDPHIDPLTIDPRVVMTELSWAELAEADLVLLLTDHDAFDYDLIQASDCRLLDTRNRLRGKIAERL